MEIWFPGFHWPDLVIREGWLCDVWILGVHLVIPPSEVFISSGFWVWMPFVIFDTAWITDPIAASLTGLQKLLVDSISSLGKSLDDFKNRIGPLLENVGITLTGTINDVGSFLQKTILGTIWGWVEGSLRWASDCLNIINDNVKATTRAINDGLSWVLQEIIGKIDEATLAIPEAVWNLFQVTLNDMVEDYYARHSPKKEG